MDNSILTAEEKSEIKRTKSNSDDFQTASVRIRKSYYKKIKDYAYTNRMEIKEVIDTALKQFLSNVDDSELLEAPEKKTKRKKVRL